MAVLKMMRCTVHAMCMQWCAILRRLYLRGGASHCAAAPERAALAKVSGVIVWRGKQAALCAVPSPR